LSAVLKYKKPSKVIQKSVINPRAVQGRPETHDYHCLLEMKKGGRGEEDFDSFQMPIQNNSYSAAVDLIKPKFAYAPFPTTSALATLVRVPYNSARPIGNATAPNYVNQTILINVANPDDPNFPNHRGGFNNVTYTTSALDKPALFKALLGETLPKSLNPIKINGFGSDYVVEVIFNDHGYTGHAIYLHGHTYWIMGRGTANEGPFIDEIDRPAFVPVTRRDTVTLLPQSWLVIRFRADNPGVWLLHCHIAVHARIAMDLVFEEGLKEAKKLFEFPKKVSICVSVTALI